jgi:protein gp37
MGENTKIEWCDHTFNPWIGCQKVSPGCDLCYAETQNAFRKWNGGTWGPHAPRKRTSIENWKGPKKWAKAAAVSGKRPIVFCASLADWLDNQVPQQWREDLAALIRETPQLDWLLLTKRIEMFGKLAPWQLNAVPKNVWIGITCEDQEHFDRRWQYLRGIDGLHFISYEPALGPLALGDAHPDWLLCGGESGAARARYMDPAWARSIRDQCAANDIAFFMKQMTRKRPIPHDLFVRQLPMRDLSKESVCSTDRSITARHDIVSC